jgi:hypothetical protein
MSAKPQNTNLLQPTKYTVTFPEISDTVYFCQKANIPGVTMAALPHPTPNLDLYVAGTKIEYGTFDITFLVNEDLSAWLDLYTWIKTITTDMRGYVKTNGQAVLTVYSNQNNPKLRVKLVNIFPLTLSDIEFDTTLSAEEHLLCSASFRYDYFEIEKL